MSVERIVSILAFCVGWMLGRWDDRRKARRWCIEHKLVPDDDVVDE